jgi:Rrf2 family transcriptional regulator, cysteine metabolism repressor
MTVRPRRRPREASGRADRLRLHAVKISAKSEYACLAMLALARNRANDPPLRIREISEAHGIPERYLVQILLQLKGAGLVTSTRGASGGYRLARPASSISLGEVLTAIEGPDAPPREGQRPAARALASVWEHVRAAERAVLDRTSIAQLAELTAPHEWVI